MQGTRITAATCRDIAEQCQDQRDYLIDHSNTVAAMADAVEQFRPETDNPEWLVQIGAVVDALRNAAIGLRNDEIVMRNMKEMALGLATIAPNE